MLEDAYQMLPILVEMRYSDPFLNLWTDESKCLQPLFYCQRKFNHFVSIKKHVWHFVYLAGENILLME
jgi:hypothetical protein